MRYVVLALSLLVFVFSPFTVLAKNKTDIPEYTVEGLKLVPNTKDIALVWAEPGANLKQYERVHILEPYVAFKKNWRRDQNRSSIRVTSTDMERIKESVKTLFLEVFKEELEKGGYVMTDERAEDVLIIRPAIINLDVTAPDMLNSSRSASFTRSAGSMTLYMELYDAVTEDIIAKAMDSKADRDNGYMQWQTGPANRTAGKRMMKPWAEALRNGLDEAKKITGSEPE